MVDPRTKIDSPLLSSFSRFSAISESKKAIRFLRGLKACKLGFVLFKAGSLVFALNIRNDTLRYSDSDVYCVAF